MKLHDRFLLFELPSVEINHCQLRFVFHSSSREILVYQSVGGQSVLNSESSNVFFRNNRFRGSEEVLQARNARVSVGLTLNFSFSSFTQSDKLVS